MVKTGFTSDIEYIYGIFYCPKVVYGIFYCPKVVYGIFYFQLTRTSLLSAFIILQSLFWSGFFSYFTELSKTHGSMPFDWVAERKDGVSSPASVRRKSKMKKAGFSGWGSDTLMKFLQNVGVDASIPVSQYDITKIINEYVNDNKLYDPAKKKRIICDDMLFSLFGKKSISKIRVYELLGSHLFDDQMLDSDASSCSSHEDGVIEQIARTTVNKAKSLCIPQTHYAAIVPENVKLIYLKRSLIENLLVESESFESKVIGCFVRIRSDPNDYLQKNSHVLVQITGIKMASEGSAVQLHASHCSKNIDISALSDNNFTKAECEDLLTRTKNGLLKRLTTVELQDKADILHKDITEHWLKGELSLLQKLIDRANEKGWRAELSEHLAKKQRLESIAEQSRLMFEVPPVIADDTDNDFMSQNPSNDKNQSKHISSRASSHVNSEIPIGAAVGPLSASLRTHFLDNLVVEQQETTEVIAERGIESKPGATLAKERNVAYEVIDLSDYEEPSGCSGRVCVNADETEEMIWHYIDPQGDTQGPFPLECLKRWRDANYFSPDFKVWRTGQRQEEALLLTDVLRTASLPCDS